MKHIDSKSTLFRLHSIRSVVIAQVVERYLESWAWFWKNHQIYLHFFCHNRETNILAWYGLFFLFQIFINRIILSITVFEIIFFEYPTRWWLFFEEICPFKHNFDRKTIEHRVSKEKRIAFFVTTYYFFNWKLW